MLKPIAYYHVRSFIFHFLFGYNTTYHNVMLVGQTKGIKYQVQGKLSPWRGAFSK
jgi:hypothetical protein